MYRHNCCTLSHIPCTGPLFMGPSLLPILSTSREELRRASFLSSSIPFMPKRSS